MRLIFIWALTGGRLLAQAELTSFEAGLSPYTAFGMGEIHRQALSRNFALAGVGVAEFDPASPSVNNPASWSDLRFTCVDFSFYGQSSILSEAGKRSERSTGGLQSLAFVFKKLKPLAVAGGITPFGQVGYEIQRTDFMTVDEQRYEIRELRRGWGGVNNAFLGASHKAIKQRLSLGLSLHYLFGSLNREWATSLYNLANPAGFTQKIRVDGMGLKVGAAYLDTLKFIEGNPTLRVGAVADFSVYHQARRVTELRNPIFSPFSDTLAYGRTDLYRPADAWAVGVAIEKGPNYSLAADFEYRMWNDSRFPPLSNVRYRPSFTVAVGGEWIPDARAAKQYIKRTAFRAGVGWDRLYIQVNGRDIYQTRVSLGLGLPLSYRSITRINLGGEWAYRGQTDHGLVREHHFRFVMGVSFTEPWLSPKKYD
jgi:hypothetical protein